MDPNYPGQQPYSGPPYSGPPYGGPPYGGDPSVGPPTSGQPYPGGWEAPQPGWPAAPPSSGPPDLYPSGAYPPGAYPPADQPYLQPAGQYGDPALLGAPGQYGVLPLPPQRRSNGTMIGLIVAGVVALLLLLGGGVWFAVSQFTESPEAGAKRFLAALQAHDLDKARGELCAEKRGAVGEESLVPTSDYTIASYSVRSTSNQTDTTADVLGSVTLRFQGEQQSADITLHMQKEDGKWRVCTIDG